MGEGVSTIEAIDAALDSIQDKVRTLLPALIVSYNPATNRATVKLGRLSKTRDGIVFGPEEFPDLPVDWPNGGGFFFRWPLNPGDEVELSVADRSLGEWQATGGVVEPTDGDAMHNLSDARVRPWICSDANPRPAPDGGLYLGRTDETGSIRISATGDVEIEGAVAIKLGALATEALVKGDAFRTLFNSHTHLYTPGALAQVATAVPVPLMDVVPGTHTSTKVKTE